MIGRELQKFKCTKEFVTAMYAALKGEMTIFLAACPRILTRITVKLTKLLVTLAFFIVTLAPGIY
jgi:hypothetical protein